MLFHHRFCSFLKKATTNLCISVLFKFSRIWLDRLFAKEHLCKDRASGFSQNLPSEIFLCYYENATNQIAFFNKPTFCKIFIQ